MIFDMDGVIVDNRRYHFKAWKIFAQKYSLKLTEKYFKSHLFGRTNRVILSRLFQRQLAPEEVRSFGEEKESIYREVYKKYIQPAKGLIKLLKALRKNGVTLAVATSALPINLNFVLEETGLKPFFHVLMDVTSVTKGKPDPEIYLKAAALLGRPSEQCIAVEDSLPGVEAALAAGMKVIGITTTYTKEELSEAHLIIRNFEGLTLKKLKELL
jgi:beta-phosphoglucomutase family hydrolase